MASVDYFLKIDGIEGESADTKHINEIELLSWSWGASQSASSSAGVGGLSAGRVSMQDFHFTMPTSKASPKLMLFCANGKHIGKATLVCRKAGESQQEYLKYTFSDLLISSYQTGGSEGSALPIDQISFTFSKIEQEYKEMKKDGSMGGPVTAGWDLTQNQKV